MRKLLLKVVETMILELGKTSLISSPKSSPERNLLSLDSDNFISKNKTALNYYSNYTEK
tara:strand:- start:30 stop:206 length:177 start_codon:yes stop_codon:yes gene_type:complete